jgi:hypothetical protein
VLEVWRVRGAGEVVSLSSPESALSMLGRFVGKWSCCVGGGDGGRGRTGRGRIAATSPSMDCLYRP